MIPLRHEPGSNSNQGRESAAESDSSQETWPTASALMAKRMKKEECEDEVAEQSVVRHVSSSDKMSLQDVARGRIDVISERMQRIPNDYIDELKAQIRVILEGNGGSQQREEFQALQKLVQSRFDLSYENLVRSHRSHLEILVAINTGIQAFLHPSISLSQASLIEVFLYKRCRNIACQSKLPGDGCTCETCTTRKGFCNFCMCVICNKFDFEVNTCRWIGCDMCSHWTHTDCAIHDGHIYMGASKARLGRPEMLFRCRACNKTSELLGWVKDVFLNCVVSWNKEALARELDYVCRIFRGSEDLGGRKLYWKCEDLIEKLKAGSAESMVSKAILLFFQELESETSKSPDNEESGQLLAPQEACGRIADVVHEAVKKMEMVADVKMRMIKKARLALEACDRDLEDKAREVAELKMERQRKKQQVEELDGIMRLKQAEADMFQLKASEARRDAERLQKIILNKSEQPEDYTSTYLKLRLEEAEAEKQFLFNKIKLQESTRASGTIAAEDRSFLCRKMSSAMKLLLFTLLVESISFISDAQLEEWCIADEQSPDGQLQRALDWACGAGGAECRQIQVNQPCYLPNTLKDHASYAFNSYYQKLKQKGAYCYFNSAAMITAADPSHGGCKYEYSP